MQKFVEIGHVKYFKYVESCWATMRYLKWISRNGSGIGNYPPLGSWFAWRSLVCCWGPIDHETMETRDTFSFRKSDSCFHGFPDGLASDIHNQIWITGERWIILTTQCCICCNRIIFVSIANGITPLSFLKCKHYSMHFLALIYTPVKKSTMFAKYTQKHLCEN